MEPGIHLVCRGCDEAILDARVHYVNATYWHGRCLRCSRCDVTLKGTCHMADGKVFCEKHFFEDYGSPCAGCGLGLSPHDMAQRADDYVYHVTCFSCMSCGEHLTSGQRYTMMAHDRLVCSKCCQKKSPLICQPSVPRRLAKLSEPQHSYLLAFYTEATTRPSKKQLNTIATALQLPNTVIKFWFQTRRSLARRYHGTSTIHHLPRHAEPEDDVIVKPTDAEPCRTELLHDRVTLTIEPHAKNRSRTSLTRDGYNNHGNINRIKCKVCLDTDVPAPSSGYVSTSSTTDEAWMCRLKTVL